MSLRCVGPHLHEAAAQTAGVHPQGPFKIKGLAALTVVTLQGAGPSWATTLEAHTGALCQEGEMERTLFTTLSS